MEQIGLKEIRQYQLEIMDEIDAYCKKNNLRYFLVGGTLLGAIRHNGFIPWDDDIDIAMPRDDYEKLVQSFSSASGKVSVINNKKDKRYYWPHSKAVHNDTELVESHNKYKIGVFIDIFPLDKVSGTREECIKKTNKVNKYKNILTLKHLKLSRDRSFVKNAVVLCGKALNLMSDRCVISKIDKLSQADRYVGAAEYWCNFLGAWGVKELVESRCFDSVEEHIFEGRMYSIPSAYDAYLSAIYGDYMTPPPVEKQVSHHSFAAYRKD